MKPSISLTFLIGIRVNMGLMRRPWPWHLSTLLTPIDFVRYREFAFAYSAILQFAPSTRKILDISSPKLLPLTLAYSLSSADVLSTDILQIEVNMVKRKSKKLDLNNLTSLVVDARSLPFNDCTFDLITAISVFEHIAPEKDGELSVVKEVARVLGPEGVLVLTVPFSRRYFAEYVVRSVYERTQSKSDERLFFQRFYDMDLLNRVYIQESGLKLEYCGFIYERFFSPDPDIRFAHYVNATAKQRIIFGPFYPYLITSLSVETAVPER